LLAGRQPRDLAPLRGAVPVVELQHNWIGLSAITAGMRQEVLDNAFAILEPVPVHTRDLARDVRLAVSEIVLASIRRMTRPAVALSHTCRNRTEREVGLGLLLMTHAASAHTKTSPIGLVAVPELRA